MSDTVTGTVDRAGRLCAADPRLAALQTGAGGVVGGAIAIPALAGLARLAHAQALLISRSIIVAEDDHDLELFVRARPEGDTVALAIGGWTVRPPRRPWIVADALPQIEPVSPLATIRWSVDASLVLTQCDGFADATGYVGRPLTAVFQLATDETDAMPLLVALAAHADFSGQRAILRSDAGPDLALDGLALRDLNGRFAGFVGTGHEIAQPDASEIEPAEAAFVERLDAALRAPLARIAASADQIGTQAEGPLRRDYADYANDIGSAARHLLALVDDLADMQAIERADFRVEPDDVDLADVARRAAGLLQVRASDRGVRVDRPAEGEALPARGDFRRILQILVNLIGNAIRYSPEGAHVWLRAERDGDRATLVVADQGRGIALDDQARVFDKFERVDPSEPEGSGLGLYISRRLARAMGGDITIDSAPGQGARFTLTLPVA